MTRLRIGYNASSPRTIWGEVVFILLMLAVVLLLASCR